VSLVSRDYTESVSVKPKVLTVNEDEEMLSRHEAAKEAGVAPGTIDRWLREPGGPPHYVFRRWIRIPAGPFRAWLTGQVKERTP
jgi:hypothetical protein